MKGVVVSLILSIILSGLPAKVWACGLGICPMNKEAVNSEKSKMNGAEEMPCHQVAGKKLKLKSKKSIKVKNLSILEKECPCPETVLKKPYLLSFELNIKKIKTSKNMLEGFSFKFNARVFKVSVHYRGPPLKLDNKIYLFNQVFLI